jgi:hypothetical protein
MAPDEEMQQLQVEELPRANGRKRLLITMAVVVGVAAVAVGCFFGGAAFEKSKDASSMSTSEKDQATSDVRNFLSKPVAQAAAEPAVPVEQVRKHHLDLKRITKADGTRTLKLWSMDNEPTQKPIAEVEILLVPVSSYGQDDAGKTVLAFRVLDMRTNKTAVITWLKGPSSSHALVTLQQDASGKWVPQRESDVFTRDGRKIVNMRNLTAAVTTMLSHAEIVRLLSTVQTGLLNVKRDMSRRRRSLMGCVDDAKTAFECGNAVMSGGSEVWDDVGCARGLYSAATSDECCFCF